MTRGIAPDFGREAESQYRLWDEILSGLWMGGTSDTDTLDYPRRIWAYGERDDPAAITVDDFDAVVTMYAYARPCDWNVEELRYPIFDGPDELDEDTVLETALWAMRRWKAGKQVLIRCQAGLNRSGLITALVLMHGDGMTARAAIDLIRAKRDPYCLCNDEFVAYLERDHA